MLIFPLLFISKEFGAMDKPGDSQEAAQALGVVLFYICSIAFIVAVTLKLTGWN